jgi:signal peptidase I
MNKPMFLFGKSAVWIVSESMEDVIPRNSYILIEKISAEDIKVGAEDGDIVMFKSDDPTLGGGYNTHRIIGKDEQTGMFISKGDHNVVEDK